MLSTENLTTLKTSVSTFCIALCIFVTGDRKDFKCDAHVECASDRLLSLPSLIGAWSGHVTH